MEHHTRNDPDGEIRKEIKYVKRTLADVREGIRLLSNNKGSIPTTPRKPIDKTKATIKLRMYPGMGSAFFSLKETIIMPPKFQKTKDVPQPGRPITNFKVLF